MATSTVPALLSAFAFGIIVNAASAGLLLHVNSHGAAIVRDGPRLVLATFLLGATVWALTAFIATAIDTTATSSCQIGIVFSTLFDQLARFSIEQYLLWAINRSATQSRAWQLVPQVLLLARFVLGAVFVGFSRPSFAPVCVPTSSTLPIAIVVVAVDAVLIAALFLRAFMGGVVADARNGQATSARSKSIVLVIVAFAIWTGTSVTMLLGIKSTALLLRTLLPAIGLLILLTVVTIRNEALTANVDRPSQTPNSPGVPSARDITTGRSVSTQDSSDAVSEYPPRRFEDLKRADLASATTSEQSRSILRPAVPPLPSNYASRSVAPAGAVDNVAAPAAKAKRSYFDRKGAGSSSKISKISNPILQQNGDQNPLNKIPTISLEEAVRSERERREVAQQEELHRDSALIAKRPAPAPPNLSPEEVARRSVSLKRKQVAKYAAPASPPPMPSSSAMDSLSSTVSTSSAQLSPGVDELRRRSPRQVSADRTSRSPPTVPSPTLPLPAPARIPIRPSRQLPESLINTPHEPPKSALQRRPTIGLPGNPRARAIEVLAKEADAGRQQTVLFMNDIVYNSPETVQGIIDDAKVKGNERFSTQSVVHRPRPIPRQNEKDRAIFPAERSPNMAGHRRNKSSNSNGGGRKSILMQSTPGSPSQLPPLPPPPIDLLYKMERPNADRPHPNDTKSMTFDEKMTLFFPTPPNADSTSGTRTQRRSSVPDMPQMPLDYMPLILSPLDGFDATTTRASRSTARTGRTSVKTESILEAADMLPRILRSDRLDPMDRVQEADQQRISAADDVGNSWLPGIAFDSLMLSGISPVPVTGGRKRASSPVLPPTRGSPASVSAYSPSPIHDDTTTNWGSVHSPVVAMPASRQVVRTMYINVERNAEPVPKNNATTTAAVANESKDKRDGSADVSEYPLLPATTYKEPEPQWHRRVGDDCPTFSDRKEPAPSRKLPPPSPLRLKPVSTKNPIIVKAAEPSPLESPERALAYIQAQLKRYEEPEVTAADTPGQGMALLANLEKEMDAQAGHWKDMQQNLRHDSMSSIQTMSTIAGGSRRQSAHSAFLARTQGKSSTLGAGRLAPATFQTPLRNSMADLGSPTPPDSDDSDVENELGRPRNIAEALSASLSGAQQEFAAKDKKTLWTPSATASPKNSTSLLWSANAISTPAYRPEVLVASVQLPSYDLVRGTRSRTLSAPLEIESSSLWTKPPATRQDSGSHGLWMAPLKLGDTTAFPTHEALSGDGQPQQAPIQAQAQAQGQTQWRLQELEQEMTAMVEDRPRAPTQLQKAPPRPATQRPPRRSRRITVLPDIVENPEPLPDKRGTLGIFRFPWGERSDTVVLPPSRVVGGALMAMPGTMASGGGRLQAAHEARARQLEEEEEAEAAEATASFFEDYDDGERYEDEEGGDSDAFGSDSDDGFDENTLWEIASLLKTEQVPSTLSMFPPPFSVSAHSVVDDYMSDLPSDDEENTNRGVVVDYDGGEDIKVDEIVIGYDVGVVDNQEMFQETSSNGMWTPQQRVSAMRGAVSAPMLFSKEVAVEEAAARAVTRTTDLDPMMARNMPRTLRTPDLAPLAKLTSSHLWTGPITSGRGPAAHLWMAAPKPERIRTETRLFDLAVAAMERLQAPVRTTDLEPAALNMPRKLRTLNLAPLPKLTSTHLWTAPMSGRSRGPQLWMPKPRQTVVRAEHHLFDRVAAAMEKMNAPVRTTDKEPVALHMPRKVRALSQAPLPKLTSTQLWKAPARAQLWVAAPKPAVVLPKSRLFDPAVAAMERRQAPVRTTDLEPAALNMPRKLRTFDHAPLPKLTSTHLWKAPARAQLWVAAPKRAVVVAQSLLFDPAVAAMERRQAPIRTTDLEPAALNMPRKLRTFDQAPLPKLTSTHLWKASAKSDSRAAQLWVPAPKPVAVLAKSLLFDPILAAIERRQTSVRTTDLEPVAVNMPRKLRTFDHAPLPKLTSTHLWTASAKGDSRAARLWVPMPKPAFVRSKSHLFDRDVAAMEKSMTPIRTSDLEPAALHMPHKLRTPSRAPLPRLESSQLWSKTVRAHTGAAQLWMPAVPTRPARVMRATRSLTGLFDKEAAAQAKQRVPTRTTAAEPIAAQTTVRGRRTTAGLPSLTLTSSALWDKNSSSSSSSRTSGTRPREWLRLPRQAEEKASMWPAEDGSVGVQQPAWWEQRRVEQGREEGAVQQRRRQRAAVSASAWDAALQEALVRSYRPSADEWDAALKEALARSYRPSAAAWDAALQEALARSYPAQSPSSPSSPSTASTVSAPTTPGPATQRASGMPEKVLAEAEDEMAEGVIVRV